ncbi:hypothetical protein [Paenibacillus amylolyticus]|uniref:hypothetical protein n=1 Tax=Paenibacillus amylolyticus TaxID=1451 RepID=UPI003EC0620E
MKTIEQLLNSDWYKNLTAELIQLKPQVQLVDHASYEASFLMNSFKERKYVLEGFDASESAKFASQIKKLYASI